MVCKLLLFFFCIWLGKEDVKGWTFKQEVKFVYYVMLRLLLYDIGWLEKKDPHVQFFMNEEVRSE